MCTLVFYFLILTIITSAVGRFLGSKFTIIFAVSFLFLSLSSSLFVLYEVVLRDSTSEVVLFNWLNLFSLYSPFVLLFDKLSSSMLVIVLLISFLVHVYASNYMQGDPGIVRFFFYLGVFTFFMCLLVSSGSLVQFFFAWEGVGLASYLLIGFWFTRAEASRAAMKAMIMNRFGDFGLYFAILLIFAFYKSLLFTSLGAVSHLVAEEGVTLTLWSFQIPVHETICFFLFIAVIGKSAQLGLHTWLPDAMEGPTPVSALLHAATMVTAGVYLLSRLSPFFECAPTVLILVAVWGGLTALFAASVGAFQNDIKKIIAYSTCSQLGYMVAACGLNNFIGAYFHLFNHAFFKALLFLGAGVVIHALGDEQDLRKYGGLLNLLPLTFVCMLIASLSLSGLPFLSGFYSKDLIINWAFSDYTLHSRFVYWSLLIAAFFTSFYSTKLLTLTFLTQPRFSFSQIKSITESDLRFKAPMVVLALFSFFSGYLFLDSFAGYGTNLLNIAVSPERNYLFEQEFLPQTRKLLPLCFIFAGAFVYLASHTLYLGGFGHLVRLRNTFLRALPWKNFLTRKWFFDFFYYHAAVSLLGFSYRFLFKALDKGLFDSISVRSSIGGALHLTSYLRAVQSGNLTNYLFFSVVVTLLVVFLFFLSSVNYALFLLSISYLIYRALDNDKDS